jgi:hypothetical protein
LLAYTASTCLIKSSRTTPSPLSTSAQEIQLQTQPPSYAARIDDDCEAFEFAYALYLARQVDREAAQMIVAAAEAELINERDTRIA